MNMDFPNIEIQKYRRVSVAAGRDGWGIQKQETSGNPPSSSTTKPEINTQRNKLPKVHKSDQNYLLLKQVSTLNLDIFTAASKIHMTHIHYFSSAHVCICFSHITHIFLAVYLYIGAFPYIAFHYDATWVLKAHQPKQKKSKILFQRINRFCSHDSGTAILKSGAQGFSR